MDTEVFDYLKAKCRHQGMTYKDLANSLELSEVSIKRIFSQRKCSLDQFHQLCDALHVHPSEVYSGTTRGDDVHKINKELENYFLENYNVFLFYRQLCFSKDLPTLKKKNGLTNKSMKLYLNELVKLKLIRLGQKGKVELLQSKVLMLPPNGRLMKRVREEWVPYFIEKTSSNPNAYNHMFKTFSMTLSPANAEFLKIRLLELEEELFLKAEKDRHTMKDEKGIGVLWAIGPYRLAIDGTVPEFQI